MPVGAYNIAITYRAYLVGSAVEYMLETTNDRPDFDLIVHPDDYMLACRMVKEKKPALNAFGGIKFFDKSSDIDMVDVWPGHLGEYMLKYETGKALAFNPNRVVEWK